VKRVETEVQVGEHRVGGFDQFEVFLSRDQATVQTRKGDVFVHAQTRRG